MCDLVRGCSARTPDLLQLLYSRWPGHRRERHDFQFLECVDVEETGGERSDRLMVVYGTNSNELREVIKNPVSAPNFLTWKEEIVCLPRNAAMARYEAASLTAKKNRNA